MGRDIYELLEKMIDKKVKGADTYINHSSRWLIFTDEKKWIFELTKTGTLWYNYYFFEKIFKIISLDVVENQHHITKWVENFIQNGVKDTFDTEFMPKVMVEDTIQNGVIYTVADESAQHLEVGDTIQNGVIYTWGDVDLRRPTVEDTIQNVVKRTVPESIADSFAIEDTIQNGVDYFQMLYTIWFPHRTFLMIQKLMAVWLTIHHFQKQHQPNFVLPSGLFWCRQYSVVPEFLRNCHML